MKVLLVHNNYGAYSGEEAVVDRMVGIFSGLGYEVAQLRMTTEGARDSVSGKIRGFIAGIYCPSGVRAMRDAIAREQPDVVNVHNLYPFISPAALRECKRAGVPVVMTIHNFRLMCPTGLFMRDGRPCELCLQRGDEWGCVRHNCEQSLLKSVGYAARNAVARVRRHYLDCVDRFACITDFQRRKLVEAGFPSEKVMVIPNAVDVAAADSAVGPAGSYVAFCGRLSAEKGIPEIIEVARRHPEIPFRLAGEVRDASLVNGLPDNCCLMGYLSGDSLRDFYDGALFFVMASRWYEGFPMAILEAARHSKPTVGPAHGGFTEIIGRGEGATGSLFTPGSVDDLEQQVVDLWRNPSVVASLGVKAREKLMSEYSSDVVAGKWRRLIESLRQQN